MSTGPLTSDGAKGPLGDAEPLKQHSCLLGVIDGKNIMVDSATAALVNTGEKHLIVTCDHVIRCFEARRKRDRNAALVISGRGANCDLPMSGFTLIARSEDLDLATYQVERPDAFTAMGKSFFAHWPPSPTLVGEEIKSVGFASKQVRQDGLRFKVDLNFLQGRITAADKPHYFSSSDPDRVFTPLREGLEGVVPTPGGLSGSPAYLFVDNAPRLVGILSATGNDWRAMFLFAEAAAIQANGSLVGI